MKKIILTSIVLVATLPLMAEGIDAVADSSRVYDLDEVVVVSQPKESFLLRQQPMSSSVFRHAPRKICGNSWASATCATCRLSCPHSLCPTMVRVTLRQCIFVVSAHA